MKTIHVQAFTARRCRQAAQIKLGRMELHYLDFDVSDDADDRVNFDALAAPEAALLPAVRAEVQAVLAWAQASFGPPTPLDDGGDWDYALQDAIDGPGGGAAQGAAQRQAISLCLSGTPQFAEALRQHFKLD